MIETLFKLGIVFINQNGDIGHASLRYLGSVERMLLHAHFIKVSGIVTHACYVCINLLFMSWKIQIHLMIRLHLHLLNAV